VTDSRTSARTRLGLALKRERERRDLTQERLAELADLSVRHVADIEGGKTNYTMETLSRLAAALDWDPLVNVTVDDTARAAERAFAKKLQRELDATLERLKAWHAVLADRNLSIGVLARKLPAFKREQEAALARLKAWHAKLDNRNALMRAPAELTPSKAEKRAQPAKPVMLVRRVAKARRRLPVRSK